MVRPPVSTRFLVTLVTKLALYFGRPGFYRGRYDGGSFGPCWTRTPIGPIWTCG